MAGALRPIIPRATCGWCARGGGSRPARAPPCTGGWEVRRLDFVLEVGDDDRPEVLAHDDCRAPIRRRRPGWSSLLIMRPANVFSISSASDCDGHFGSGNGLSSRVKVTLYASTPSSRRLVACVQNVFACSQALRLLALYALSRFWLGTWQRKNTS